MKSTTRRTTRALAIPLDEDVAGRASSTLRSTQKPSRPKVKPSRASGWHSGRGQNHGWFFFGLLTPKRAVHA